MMRLVAVLCGLLFGAGLALSDMVNPARVLAFLDVTGAWDPTLAFVMASALVPSALAYAWRRKRDRPLVAPEFNVPDRRRIDAPLVTGAALFGIGWGLVGLCPGPAVAGLVLLGPPAFAFVLAMLAGMAIHRVLHIRAH